jgi:SAM-dependent methyltransferase
LFFPLMLGEVITKTYFLKKEGYVNIKNNVILIVAERVLDFIIIILLGLLFLSKGINPVIYGSTNEVLMIILSIIAVVFLLIIFIVESKVIVKLSICFLAGIIGWAVIYLIYFFLPQGVSHSVSLNDFGYLFSNYLVIYPATPMGLFTSGNILYISLEKLVISPALLLQSVINIRIASVAPTLIIGFISTLRLIKDRKKQTQFHFDEISDEYSGMIPEHIRERLIERKCGFIFDSLKKGFQNTNGLTGLDLGGGKGWYTSRMIDLTGSNVILVERSKKQAKDAVKRDPRIQAVIADIEHLPFKENSIDYGFSINVFHHLENNEAQLRAFNSISCVLKRGKRFFLHEMNVRNIFFKIYMEYLFPLLKTIDEGIECWVDPGKNKFGPFISNKIVYFTFLPDFMGVYIIKPFLTLERWLEHSRVGKYSAHYFRVFENIKEG